MKMLLLHCLVVLGFIGGTTACARAQDRLLADAQSRAFASVAERVAPRVVQLRYFGGAGEILSKTPAPVSGLLLEDPGWVLTSGYGLDSEPAAAVVRFPDQTEAPAELVGRDLTRSLVLFRVELSGAELRATPLTAVTHTPVGAWAIAVGRASPSGGHNLSVGVISAHGRLGGRAMQTDASLSPSNYGGPLVNVRGELIGLITPLAPPGQSGLAWYDSGVGFVTPWREIRIRIERLKQGETIEPGWLGMKLEDGGQPYRQAATIEEVVPGGPSADAGLLPGDQIVSLDRQITADVATFRRVLGVRDAGEVVSLTVVREGGEHRVAVKLTPRTPTPDGP